MHFYNRSAPLVTTSLKKSVIVVKLSANRKLCLLMIIMIIEALSSKNTVY